MKLSRTQMKEAAQDLILSSARSYSYYLEETAFNRGGEFYELSDEQKQEMRQEAKRQLERVKKLFGY